MQKFEVTSEAKLETVVHALFSEIEKRQTDTTGAVVLAFHGDLGAGKTTTVQVLARLLGITERVVSPTFVVMKSYEIMRAMWKRFVHIDAYRIESDDEMRVLYFADILAEQDTIVCIEWAERIEALLPAHTIHVRFTLTGEDRVITIE